VNLENRLLIFIGLVVLAIVAKLAFRKLYAVLKPLPIVFILILAFLKSTQPPPIWVAAIAFGLVGDILLVSDRVFLPGLVSFLLGHCFYIIAFARETGGIYFSPALVLGVGSVASGAWLYFARVLIQARRKKYILPILIYVITTGIMLIAAFAHPLVSAAVLGAAAFAFSDFLLAFNKFVRQSWYVQAGVSLTYYAAQWLLAVHFHAI
jgi:uncharacterized membrane protein YhhN